MAPEAQYLTEPVTFYIGHHETRRSYEVTEEILHHAQDENYDMLTAPITTDAFHSRVLSILSNHLNSTEGTELSSSNNEWQSSLPPAPIIPRLTPSDTALSPNESISQLIFLTSPWIDLCSSDPLIADISRQVLALEVAYASFCGASNVMIQGPTLYPPGHEGDGLPQYARAIQDALSAGIYLQLHISLPMTVSSDLQSMDDLGNLANFARPRFTSHFGDGQSSDEDALASWDAWNVIRSNCNYHSRLSVALKFPKQTPPSVTRQRWFSEPLRILEIPASSFHKSPKGQVTLSESQCQLLALYMRHRTPPWLLLSDIGPLPGLDEDEDSLPHENSFDPEDNIWESDPTPAEASRYPQLSTRPHPPPGGQHLRHLRYLQTRQPAKPPIERFGAGYQDYLQNPLQPLTDNLESITYEVFEKDPVKYDWYERAIAAALRDWAAQGKPASGPRGGVVVAVVGAGRGPLVTRALQASAISGVKIEMWAVEKNPNAFVLLQRHNATKWNHRVHLVHSDMRSWSGPLYSETTDTATPPSNHLLSSSESPPTKTVHIDILVSELLGSFADNELSPECLDGVQHLLNPTHGLSIPTSYTAHLTPIAAPKIHADIAARSASGVQDAAQIPYVVMLHAIDYLSTSKASADVGSEEIPLVQRAWEFSHPIPPNYLERLAGGSATTTGNEHNRRYSRLEFPCKERGVCHGLGGYFETVLYEAHDDGRSPHSNETTTSRPSPSSPPKTKSDAAAVAKTTKIELSTNPLTQPTKSADMISWFPIYFPLQTPLYVPGGSVLVTHLWRQTDGRKVWYEWLVECFLQGRRKVRIGGSGLHSSVGNGCLM